MRKALEAVLVWGGGEAPAASVQRVVLAFALDAKNHSTLTEMDTTPCSYRTSPSATSSPSQVRLTEGRGRAARVQLGGDCPCHARNHSLRDIVLACLRACMRWCALL